MRAGPLRLVNAETGEVHDGCPRCVEVDIDAVAALQDEVTKLAGQVRKLKRDRNAEREADPERRTILALIEHWKWKTGHPKSNVNAGDRFDVIKARLREGYTAEHLELAIDGLGAFPYVVNGQRLPHGKDSQRHDRLGIAMGGGEDVERFAKLGYIARKSTGRNAA